MSQTDKTKVLQEKLNLNLREIYPLAQKADEQLEQLKIAEKGKFSAIFQPDAGFKAQSNRFLPYLIELSDDVKKLADSAQDGLPAELQGELQSILGKIQKMLLILNRFHAIK